MDSNNPFTIRKLSYSVNINNLVTLLGHFEGVTWLNSERSTGNNSQFSYLTAAPLASYVYLPSTDKPPSGFLHCIKLLNTLNENGKLEEGIWPGGIAGYISYDLGEKLFGCYESKTVCSSPLAEVNIFDWAITIDHKNNSCWFVSQEIQTDELPESFQKVLNESQKDKALAIFESLEERQKDSRLETESYENFQLTSPFKSVTSKENYAASFKAIQDYLQAGDCYQVNLTQRFNATYKGSSRLAWKKISGECPAPYQVYFESEHGSLLSFSPEQFVEVECLNAQTKPIKGTRPRSVDSDKDQRALLQLKASPKDQAENLMIVDLLRNDFGKVCVPGSVKVNQLFEIESFHNVHHLVSKIEGQLEKSEDALDLFFACFPGGSITGAPKKRAMEIINELEPHNRNVYCGSFFISHPSFGLKSNILIRTFYCQPDGTISTWAGGGIVADSELEAEHQECFDKIGSFIEILEKGF